MFKGTMVKNLFYTSLEDSMKKITFCTILAFCFILLAGCNKKNKEIIIDDVKTNTLLVKNDGTVQAAFVEAFDQDYYNLTELNDYVSQEINKYNSEAGVDAVALGSLEIKDKNVVLLLNYTGLDHYSNFNQIDMVMMNLTDFPNSEVILPDTFYSAKNKEVVTKDTVMENEKCKVLIVNEGINVLVDGKVKYYSNGQLLDSSELQAASEGQTIIIYKP